MNPFQALLHGRRNQHAKVGDAKVLPAIARHAASTDISKMSLLILLSSTSSAQIRAQDLSSTSSETGTWFVVLLFAFVAVLIVGYFVHRSNSAEEQRAEAAASAKAAHQENIE